MKKARKPENQKIEELAAASAEYGDTDPASVYMIEMDYARELLEQICRSPAVIEIVRRWLAGKALR